MGCGYKLFSAFQLANDSVDNESPYFQPFLSETARRYECLERVLGDGAFASSCRPSLGLSPVETQIN